MHVISEAELASCLGNWAGSSQIKLLRAWVLEGLLGESPIPYSPQIPLTCTGYSVQLRNRLWLHKITLIWEFPVTTA